MKSVIGTWDTMHKAGRAPSGNLFQTGEIHAPRRFYAGICARRWERAGLGSTAAPFPDACHGRALPVARSIIELQHQEGVAVTLRVLAWLTNGFPVWVFTGGVLALFCPDWFT